uniref:DNA ligase 1-like isoform X2 n=1 Tax=Oncorhynchus gorbuscha TaxID=8017 RepID=UPI001EAF7512|nr:DNA ligase 1-like isoform X2 [Oncorhynchus gorbuscha]
MRDLLMYDGFNQLNEERVGNQLVLSSLSRALNEVKDTAFWRSLRKGINTFTRENEIIKDEMKKKDMRNFNSAKDRRAERKRARRRERERERNCDLTTWMPSRSGMESSIIGLRPRPPSQPLLREPVLARTSFSRTDARTIEVREMILQRSRIAYKIKCLQRRKAAAEGLTLTEGGGGSEDGGDGKTVMDITGQSKKASKGKGSKGKESGGGEGSDWAKFGLEEIVETDDRNKEKRTKVRTRQRSKDKRREERERQRCSKETDLISDELARMDIEKIDGHKADETISKISEENISNNCCVETNKGEKYDRKQIKEKTSRTNVHTDEGVMSKASWEREEAGEENAKTFQESLKVQEVIDGEEGPTGRKLEHQKARDSEEIRNSDGYVKMREIGKRKEVEVEVTKICTSCDEMSIMVLENQGNARPMTDSQTPLKGKGKQQHSLPYKRTEGLQEEINSKGEMLQGGRQVNFPWCQAQKHRSPGVLGDVAGFWRKEKRVHKEKDREEKDRVGQTWRDQGGNDREQWNGETERGGVGRSRRARQKGNQLLLFSRQKHSNWNDSHPSESSCDWRSREKEVPEKHVENRMDRQRGERPLKREKS